jgi:DNA-binding transcriptional regulator WhiA
MKTDYFHKIDSEEKAYWLGFILGDGCLHKNGSQLFLSLKESDSNQLLKFAKAIKWNDNLSYYDVHLAGYTKVHKAVRMIVNSKQLHVDLVALGVTPAKSLTVKWPKISKKYERHMLRGLFDADGSINTGSNHGYGIYVRFALTGTKNILSNAKRILKIDSKISQGHGNCWDIQKTGKASLAKVYDLLYRDATVWLDRKQEKFEELIK